MVKPFSPTELAACIRATLRRREVLEPPKPYVLCDLAIDYGQRRVTLAGRPVAMVAMEYRLLAELSAHAGRVLTYEYLQNRVWVNGARATAHAHQWARCAASWATTRRTLPTHRVPRRLPHAGRHGTEPPVTSRLHEPGRIASPTVPA